ncbi:helix-turn-helix transcriptional regulator [Aliirhizobium terrae]|uniref:helix-turn-helix domain-containing protein n=1 Tax=Terrirhizobium terrae TaxID=2926709 RepID=UPI0025789214|nr:helix-turn-helix transcriptional regulator [Rhizobium sp. CC-CFT758]WJH40273.1 helix-turn-helix transcriptional regulator [Rhizobium sp. CC-CFT758]
MTQVDTITRETTGDVLREWRKRRRLSQLELALEADISARHLSFVESGRASPSRDVLANLAERLSMPLRARNRLMLSAGYAPAHSETNFDGADLAHIRDMVRAILVGHMPFPAIAIDGRWTLLEANAAAASLFDGIDPALLTPPVNVLRLSLHPEGLASRIANLGEWRHHVLERLHAQMDSSGDGFLATLHDELTAYPAPSLPTATTGRTHPSIAVPLELRDLRSDRVLRFISTTTVFSTATSVTLSELSLECFYPADEATRAALTGAEEIP